jgi:hypothetical protein
MIIKFSLELKVGGEGKPKIVCTDTKRGIFHRKSSIRKFILLSREKWEKIVQDNWRINAKSNKKKLLN